MKVNSFVFPPHLSPDKLKIAELEGRLELIGHAAQQVIGTAQGSFWLGRNHMSVSAYTINQLRKLVGYDRNEPPGRWAPGEIADVIILRADLKNRDRQIDILREQLAKACGDRDAYKKAYATSQQAHDMQDLAWKEINEACTQAISERDAWKKESELLREEKRVTEGKAKQFESASAHWYAEHNEAQDKLKAAQADLDRLRGEIAALVRAGNEIAAERNQARAELDVSNKRTDAINDEANRLAEECGKAREERDAEKARADQNAKLAEQHYNRLLAMIAERDRLRAQYEGAISQLVKEKEANDTLTRAAGGPDAGELHAEVAKLSRELGTAKIIEKGLREENQRRAETIQGKEAKIKELKWALSDLRVHAAGARDRLYNAVVGSADALLNAN